MFSRKRFYFVSVLFLIYLTLSILLFGAGIYVISYLRDFSIEKRYTVDAYNEYQSEMEVKISVGIISYDEYLENIEPRVKQVFEYGDAYYLDFYRQLHIILFATILLVLPFTIFLYGNSKKLLYTLNQLTNDENSIVKATKFYKANKRILISIILAITTYLILLLCFYLNKGLVLDKVSFQEYLSFVDNIRGKTLTSNLGIISNLDAYIIGVFGAINKHFYVFMAFNLIHIVCYIFLFTVEFWLVMRYLQITRMINYKTKR